MVGGKQGPRRQVTHPQITKFGPHLRPPMKLEGDHAPLGAGLRFMIPHLGNCFSIDLVNQVIGIGNDMQLPPSGRQVKRPLVPRLIGNISRFTVRTESIDVGQTAQVRSGSEAKSGGVDSDASGHHRKPPHPPQGAARQDPNAESAEGERQA
jgi:hypothetical protein